MAENQNRIK